MPFMLKRDPKRLFLRFVDRGDAAALGKVFDLMAPELLALALHLTRHRDSAEDALQDTFLTIADTGARFDRSRAFEPWIVGILVNRARKARDGRNSGGRARSLSTADSDGTPAAQPSPSRQAEEREAANLVRDAIGKLEEPYRSVVEVHLTEGLPPREIAPRLGRAPGTVRVQLHRGLEMLRGGLRLNGGAPRPELLALAPPAAAMLGAEPGRGLAAIKAEVLEAATTQQAVGVGAGTASAASLHTLSLVGALTILGAGGAWIAGSGSVAHDGGDLARESNVAVRTEASADARLVAVTGGSDQHAKGSITGRAALATPTDDASTKRRSTRNRSSSADRKEEASALSSVPFKIKPVVDDRFVHDIELSAAVRYFAYEGVDQLVSGSTLHAAPEPFSIGSYQDALSAPKDVLVTYDHPGAMPCSQLVKWKSWRRSRGGYTSSPRFVLEPIGTRLKIKYPLTYPADVKPAAGLDGEVLLFELQREGAVIHDRQRIKNRLEGTVLRSQKAVGRRYLLYSPTHAVSIPCLVRTDVGSDDVQEVVTPFGIGWYAPYACSVLDPFGQPIPESKVRAVVPSARIAWTGPVGNLRGNLNRSVAPDAIEIEGWVFAEPEGPDALEYAGYLDPRIPEDKRRATWLRKFGGAKRLNVLPVRPLIEGMGESEGMSVLVGVVDGAHAIQVLDPLGSEEWITALDSGFSKGAFDGPSEGLRMLDIPAPVAGILLERPVGIAAGLEESTPAEAWRAATIKVTSPHGDEVPHTIDHTAANAARIVVRPWTDVRITVQSGERTYTASTRSMGAGELHHIVPVLPPRDRLPMAEEGTIVTEDPASKPAQK